MGAPGCRRSGGPTRRTRFWSIVAFVRHLPALSPEEKLALGRGGAREETPATPAPAAGASSDESNAGSPAGAGHHVHQVSISGFKFTPDTVEVHVGDVVEWKNTDFVAHTATADDRKSFETGRIDSGQTKRITARTKGRFPYFCRYHAAMKGTLVVQ